MLSETIWLAVHSLNGSQPQGLFKTLPVMSDKSNKVTPPLWSLVAYYFVTNPVSHSYCWLHCGTTQEWRVQHDPICYWQVLKANYTFAWKHRILNWSVSRSLSWRTYRLRCTCMHYIKLWLKVLVSLLKRTISLSRHNPSIQYSLSSSNRWSVRTDKSDSGNCLMLSPY